MNTLLNKIINRNNGSEFFTPSIPQGNRVYCIGDIHGRDDLLIKLADNVNKEGNSYHGKKSAVFLGDYIDRGMHSKAVVDLLTDANFLPEFEKIFLCGNHEQSLLSFLNGDGSILKEWWRFGAQTTFHSYGITIAGIPPETKYVELQEQLKEAIPDHHLHFYHSLKQSWTVGDYFFVHAGIKPNVTLDQQRKKDLLWIREEFLNAQKIYEKMIVHGHSIVSEPEFLPNRIAIDTGAYNSGTLTCLVLESETQYTINNHTLIDTTTIPHHLASKPLELTSLSSYVETLDQLLKTYQDRTQFMEAVALVTEDGRILASALPPHVDGNALTERSASLLKSAMEASALLKQGKLEQVIVQNKQGYIVLMNLGSNLLLLTIVNQKAKLGQILFDMQETVNEITKIQQF